MSTIIIENPTNNFSNPNPLFIFNMFKEKNIVENPTNNFSNPNPLFAYNNMFNVNNYYRKSHKQFF
jgi:hypothetical protein